MNFINNFIKIKEINNSNEQTFFIDTYYDKLLSVNYIITANCNYQNISEPIKIYDFKKEFSTIIDKTFEYMKYWKKINKELEKDLESYKMKADTESTEIIMDSFDEDTIIQ